MYLVLFLLRTNIFLIRYYINKLICLLLVHYICRYWNIQYFDIQVQRDAAQILNPHFSADGVVKRCLQYAQDRTEHIMDFTKFRALNALFSMINECIREIQNYNQQHSDFPMQVTFPVICICLYLFNNIFQVLNFLRLIEIIFRSINLNVMSVKPWFYLSYGHLRAIPNLNHDWSCPIIFVV